MAWEESWLAHVDQWTEELRGVPGVFAGECHMECLDAMGADAFMAWYGRVVDQ